MSVCVCSSACVYVCVSVVCARVCACVFKFMGSCVRTRAGASGGGFWRANRVASRISKMKG